MIPNQSSEPKSCDDGSCNSGCWTQCYTWGQCMGGQCQCYDKRCSILDTAVMAKANDTAHVLVEEQHTVPVERRVDNHLHQRLIRAVRDAANILDTRMIPNQSSEPKSCDDGSCNSGCWTQCYTWGQCMGGECQCYDKRCSILDTAVMVKANDRAHVLVEEQLTVPVERRVDNALHQRLIRAVRDAENILDTRMIPNQSSDPKSCNDASCNSACWPACYTWGHCQGGQCVCYDKRC